MNGSRDHTPYQRAADDNGRRHCAEEGQPGSSRKLTERKLDYDKYVDSHIKPFRYKSRPCVHISCASNAWLLRHERGVHATYGPGLRPHLCKLKGCERSLCGFSTVLCVWTSATHDFDIQVEEVMFRCRQLVPGCEVSSYSFYRFINMSAPPRSPDDSFQDCDVDVICKPSKCLNLDDAVHLSQICRHLSDVVFSEDQVARRIVQASTANSCLPLHR